MNSSSKNRTGAKEVFMKNHKKSNVKKHRGNPHGNPKNYGESHSQSHHVTSDDNLRQSVRPGVSKSERWKQ